MTFLIFSCKTTEKNQEEKFINEVLFSIIADNPDIFTSDCKLFDKFSNRFTPPSVEYDIDSTFIESIKDLFDEREFGDLLRQKQNLEKFGFVTTDFKLKYKLVRETEIDSLIDRIKKSKETDKPLDYWTEFENEIGCLQSFSRPIISIDRKTVIIRHMHIKGPLADGGFIMVFQLKNGKWIEVKKIQTWIS
jgi:hypothetical protein